MTKVVIIEFSKWVLFGRLEKGSNHWMWEIQVFLYGFIRFEREKEQMERLRRNQEVRKRWNDFR